jgi:hypothetical protein
MRITGVHGVHRSFSGHAACALQCKAIGWLRTWAIVGAVGLQCANDWHHYVHGGRNHKRLRLSTVVL